MNLHLLRIFHAVADRRSFSRAAEALCITQPAVSKGVRELERQLGLPLLERGAGVRRGSRAAALTENGQTLFEHARGIFALERAATEDLLARAHQERGRLIVGASTTIAGYWLPPYIARFAQQHPATQLEVRVGNTQSVAQALLECETDLALVEGAVQDPRLLASHWQDEPLQIVAQPDVVAALGGRFLAHVLEEQLWLVREPGSGTRAVSEQLLRDLGVVPRRTVEFASNEGIARSVAAGLGIAMLPGLVVRELVAMGELGALRLGRAAPLVRPLFLLALRERPASPLAVAFQALLRLPID